GTCTCYVHVMATQISETRTERVVVLMTPSEKRAIAERARDAGLSTGEYMRLAAEFEAMSPLERDQLEFIAEELRAAVERTTETLDRLDAVSARASAINEDALREKYRREFEARDDIDWAGVAHALGLGHERL